MHVSNKGIYTIDSCFIGGEQRKNSDGISSLSTRLGRRLRCFCCCCSVIIRQNVAVGAGAAAKTAIIQWVRQASRVLALKRRKGKKREVGARMGKYAGRLCVKKKRLKEEQEFQGVSRPSTD